MGVDYAPAQWLGNPNIHYGGWGVFVPKWIVVHGTAGDASPAAVATTFAQRNSSTHYAIGPDGSVGQYVPENQAAWGNGPITGGAGVAVAGSGNAHDAWWDTCIDHNPNTQTFSIEHCKTDTTNGAPITPAQAAASFALIKHLCDTHGIPYHVYGSSSYAELATGGVTGHFSMDPINRAFCPGSYPWADLAAYLTGGGAGMGVPNGWHDSANGDANNDAGILTAPNGVPVVQGFRYFVLTHPWSADNWPLAPEAGAAHPDPIVPSGCAGSYQPFTTLWLVWQSCDNHVFYRWMGPIALLFGKAAQAAATPPAPVVTGPTPAQVAAVDAALGVGKSLDQALATLATAFPA